MATGSNRQTARPSEDETAGYGQLNRDDLYSILRQQIRGRNEKYMQPDFQRMLAEEVIVTKIGSFYYGERLLDRSEDPQLHARSDRIATLASSQAITPRLTGTIFILEALQDDPCICANLSGLTITGVHLSGSKLEGCDVRLSGSPWEWSDIDVMLQLGPVTVFGEASAAPTASASRLPSGITVTSENVTQKGFFLLHHERLPLCSHRDLQLFSGRRFKEKLLRVVKMNMLKDGNFSIISFGGPALQNEDRETSADIVPCISYPPWPHAEFAARARPTGHPSAVLVKKLCHTPALLVPVGSAHSVTKQHEWRLSFSRHEFLAHCAMPQTLCDCLAVLKYANAVVNGPRGALKGFQLKTAVLWLAEKLGKEELERLGFHECLLTVLRFVEQSAASGRLDCYFWTEINLLNGRSEEELVKLGAAVRHLQRHLATAVRVLIAIFVFYKDSGVRDNRLPSRSCGDLQEFMFPGIDRLFVRSGSGRHNKYFIPGTWMSKENIEKLFSRHAPVQPLYDRVMKKLETPSEAEQKRKASKGNCRPVRWTDHS